eukprot:jgi/Psemu1/302570/fgenesh1_kg.73_\
MIRLVSYHIRNSLFCSRTVFTEPYLNCVLRAAFKFDTDPYNVELHGYLTNEQYTEAIENLNRKLRPSRAGAIDGALLVTGPLLVPLALLGVRHRSQTKRRKKFLKEAMHEFNMQYPELLMRWNRRPAISVLVIEPRQQTNIVSETQIGFDSPGRGATSGREEGMPVAQATFLSHSATPAYGSQHQMQQQQPHIPQLRQSSQRQQQQQQQQQRPIS